MDKRSYASFLIVGLMVLLLVEATGAKDFSRLQDARETTREKKRDLSEKIIKLWTGSGISLKRFEPGVINDRLFWVYATLHEIHVVNSESPSFGRSNVKKTISGEIIGLDLYDFSEQSNKSLITVNHRTDNSILTTVFALTVTGEKINFERVDQVSGAALRPLHQYMYGQSFSPASFWSPSVFRYKTTSTGYQQRRAMQIPGPSKRILAMTPLETGDWAYVNGHGDLIISSANGVRGKLEGNFGLTTDSLKTNRSMNRRPEEDEPIRLPPVFMDDPNLLGVVKNPVSAGGLFGFLSGAGGSEASSIKLWKYDGRSLREFDRIGPLQGRILDVDVPESNQSQILWLRSPESDKYVLEMIDFS